MISATILLKLARPSCFGKLLHKFKNTQFAGQHYSLRNSLGRITQNPPCEPKFKLKVDVNIKGDSVRLNDSVRLDDSVRLNDSGRLK